MEAILNQRVEFRFFFHRDAKLAGFIQNALKNVESFQLLEPEDPNVCKRVFPNSGQQIIPTTKLVNGNKIVQSLKKAGYSVVSITLQLVVDVRDISGKTRNWELVIKMIHGTFFNQKLFQILEDIFYYAFWQIKVFKNKEIMLGSPVKDKYWFSVACSGRHPIFTDWGQAIKNWPKDENGKKITKDENGNRLSDDHKIQDSPNAYLDVVDDEFKLIVA